MSGNISGPLIRRMPAYYRYLRELEEAGAVQISSQELGDRMQLTASQVRQDINSFGGFGRTGYGYPVRELKEHIRKILGLDREHRMVIIGAGRMGRALADYACFGREGFRTVALFDTDPAKIRMSTARLPVFPARELEDRMPETGAEIAVLAVPVGEAQAMLDRVYAAGIRAVWNFVPIDLTYPDDMAVVNVHLIDSLHTLSYRIREMNGD